MSQKLLAFLRYSHYKESTLTKYEKELRVSKYFCEDHSIRDYTIELGNKYAQDVYIDDHFSAQRYFSRDRVTRLLNSYLTNGHFNLAVKHGTKFDAPKIRFQNEYEDYKSFIYTEQNEM